MWRSFCPRRTGESWLTPDSPDLASFISVRSKNGSLQRLNALWSAFAQPSPLQETESFSQSIGSEYPRTTASDRCSETRTLLTNGSRFTLLAGLGRSARGGSDGGPRLPRSCQPGHFVVCHFSLKTLAHSRFKSWGRGCFHRRIRTLEDGMRPSRSSR
jgi:hypothetical protein